MCPFTDSVPVPKAADLVTGQPLASSDEAQCWAPAGCVFLSGVGAGRPAEGDVRQSPPCAPALRGWKCSRVHFLLTVCSEVLCLPGSPLWQSFLIQGCGRGLGSLNLEPWVRIPETVPTQGAAHLAGQDPESCAADSGWARRGAGAVFLEMETGLT